MDPETPPSAPAVVAVVVTCDPGSWFEEVLQSLASQDYPNLSVLIVDAGGVDDPTPTVARYLPAAFVRRLETRVGFGAAANEVLDLVEGASHYLFCHDDVALAPDAVRLLVEEAFRSNAGVASPKYVMWDEPDRLLALGASTDKVGALRTVVDRGELDQQQHDAVREILVAPSGATLVRSDLFSVLGGFDRVVDSDGEDLDLSWRARLAGARLVVVPSARVRHLEATATSRRRPAQDASRRAHAHRHRTVLTCYRWYTLLWLVPLAVIWALGEAATLAVQGHPAAAWMAVAAMGDAFRRPGELLAARRRVQSGRSVGDSALRQLQVRGNSRLRAYLQSRVETVRRGLPASAGSRAEEGRSAGRSRRGGAQGNVLLGLLLFLLLLFGTRDLLDAGLPHIGRLPYTGGGWSGIWASWWSAWQPAGLGVAGPASPALALLGLLGTVLVGAVGTLQHLVVLGPLFLGPLGAYRAARFWGSTRGRVVAAVFYAVVPLSYNALARGRWDGLVVYAAVPWCLSVLTRLSGLMPAPPVRIRRTAGRVVGLGLLVAATASVAPSFLYVLPLMGACLLAGSALAGRPLGSARLLALAMAASAVGFVLLLPWSATVLGTRAALVPTVGPGSTLGFGQVLQFHTGPYGAGAWEWLLLVAAALPLFVGKDWRLEWASRLWVVALAFFGLAWAGSRGWLPDLPPEVALAPAAAALAGCAALGAAAFELDLPGYEFGWRQGAAAVAGISLAVASIPFLIASGGGRWDLPSADSSAVLSLLPTSGAGEYRVLWVGSSEAVPLAGWRYERGFVYATSSGGTPALADDWATGSEGAAPILASDLRLAEGRLTTKLGHLLAAAGVRYIVVPNHVGPSGSGSAAVPVPTALLAGMALQTDVHPVGLGDADFAVYQNDAWAPVRAVPPPSAVPVLGLARSAAQRSLQDTDLRASQPVLDGGTTGGSGPVPTGSPVYVAATRDGGWHLEGGGRSIAPAPAFGWAMSFTVPSAAARGKSVPARLGYQAPFLVRAGDIVQVLLWLGATALVVLDSRRRAAAGGYGEEADPGWFVPAERAARRRSRSGRSGRSRAHPPPEPDVTGEEIWTDV